jgi:hypothetical protein
LRPTENLITAAAGWMERMEKTSAPVVLLTDERIVFVSGSSADEMTGLAYEEDVDVRHRIGSYVKSGHQLWITTRADEIYMWFVRPPRRAVEIVSYIRSRKRDA